MKIRILRRPYYDPGSRLACRPSHEMFSLATCNRCGFEGPNQRFITTYRPKKSPYDHYKMQCPKCKNTKIKHVNAIVEV